MHSAWMALVSGDRTERSQIGNDRGGVLVGHAELRHGWAERLACFPNASGEQSDEFGVASRRRTGDSRGLQGPIGNWHRRLYPQRGAFEPAAAVEVSGVVAGSVAHAAHGDAFDEVLSAGYESGTWFLAGFVGLGLLGIAWGCEDEEEQ